MKKLSNQPPKGMSDWLPGEYKIRKYIFDTWRSVCTQFGYEEYLTPIVESAEIYRAKSGEDVGGKELMTMTDRAGRELAIRPEMTPSVTRMVSKIYQASPKPLRLFSIANFMRNEKPQKGRNREFWQLNFDIFGSESINADVEVLQMAIEIMKAFNAPKGSFMVYLNDRYWIKDMVGTYVQAAISADNKMKVIRLIDKYDKIGEEVFCKEFEKLADFISEDELQKLLRLLNEDADEVERYMEFMQKNYPDSNLLRIIAMLDELGYGEYIQFNPRMVRGFDYYDGMVFEVFPEKGRALFGGGRYNGLARLFGGQEFPAVGCAPGDEPMRIFLEENDLIPDDLDPEKYYIPLLDETLIIDVNILAGKLRSEDKIVEIGVDEKKIGKALEYANKKNISKVVILGVEEKSRGVYKIKNMNSGKEEEFII